MHLLHLENTPIYEQLKLEEALLRADKRDFCLINTGAPDAIVMGLSSKPEKLVDLAKINEKPVPLIKRFSGGGTVYIDQETLFVSFICSGRAQPFPKAIMEWTYTVLKPIFPDHFQLRENDFVLGERKCGGNAQYIQKERWLHHISFLWDYEETKMNYLLLPEKRPAYRKERSHDEFLTPLSKFFKSKKELLNLIKSHLQASLKAKEISKEELSEVQARPHRSSTHFWSLD